MHITAPYKLGLILLATIPEYIFEIASKHQNQGSSTLEDAIAFAERGKRDRAWWICSDLLNKEISEDIDNDKKEEILLRNKACLQHVDAHDAEDYSKINISNVNSRIIDALSQLPKTDSEVETIDELLKLWRADNIEKFKLSKCIA